MEQTTSTKTKRTRKPKSSSSTKSHARKTASAIGTATTATSGAKHHASTTTRKRQTPSLLVALPWVLGAAGLGYLAYRLLQRTPALDAIVGDQTPVTSTEEMGSEMSQTAVGEDLGVTYDIEGMMITSADAKEMGVSL